MNPFSCSPFRVDIYTDAAAFPPDWNATLPEHHPLRQQESCARDAVLTDHITPIYAAVYAGEKPVLLVSFQVLRIRNPHIDTRKMKRWQRQLWEVFSRIQKPRLLVSGHLFRHDFPAIYFPENVPVFEAFKAYRQALRTAARQTHADAVLLKDTPEVFQSLVQHFTPQYRLLPGDISMELTLAEDWQTLADYEKALKHKYAQRMRNIRRAGAGLDIRELDTAAVVENAGALHRLYLQVAQNQPLRLGFLPEEYLPFLKRRFPEIFRVWAFYEAEKPVAFASAWQHPRVLDMFYIGFDYERNRERQLYFNILFSAIERGISLGVPKIIFGRTALEAKARLGAKPVYLHSFLYIRNPVARAVVDKLQTSLAENEGDWESRHPFK